ncbi:FAD-dependent oxidoreductase [Clostridium tarantellae]|uniref:MBL fold metallo-hydrolase n=1 Tax=Clostridium tarantellae TaxID=39493 RepID=A0A6I1MSS0_9CLOT|nr:FAD-dependent oxidoreductase [Clostridium tarantellae]MPQ43289.1 MBL fold metallo-hydrolase [Clostridium tarantellae]
MQHLEIKNDIYWVGALDPNLRVFDIIMYTPYGTTYNSYVVKGNKKIAVFETVKAHFFDEYIKKLESLGIDPRNIDYIVVDHTEPDHAGSVENLIKLAPKAKVVGSIQAINFLKDIVNDDFEYIIVEDGDTLNLGNKTLQFISAPFLHWPDSMYTYIPEDSTLITCDSFGSHYCSDKIFNDLISNENDYMDALKYYFDCIFGPYTSYMLKAIEKIENLNIDLVCPGHGPVLRDNPWKIINIYKQWSTPVIPKITGDKKVTICYVSAYGYTAELANKIAEGIKSKHNVEVKMYDVIHHNLDEILKDISESDGILFGSPTIVGELLVPIRNVLTNLNPIVHGGKYAAAFGSYGWSGEAVPRIESRLLELRMKLYGPGLKIRFKPSKKELEDALNFGSEFSDVMFGVKNINYNPNGNSYIKDDTIVTDGKKRYWKCLVCGEIFESDTVPEFCEVCGASSDQFIEVQMEKFESINTNDTFVVIGNGAAGFYAAKTIREINNTCTIKIMSNEDVSSYSRPQLSDILIEDINDSSFYLQSKEWYKENNINEILNSNVVFIDKCSKFILLEDGEKISYDKLILANGSHNFLPPIKIKSLTGDNIIESITINNYKNIYGLNTIKTLKDALILKEQIKTAKKAVVIGAGPLGLEAAWEMHNAGLEVTVVEFLSNPMQNQLDLEGASIFKEKIKNCGLEFLMEEQCTEILTENNKIVGIELKSGKKLNCDILLVSTGIRSNISLAQSIGIQCNKGIIVNENMETSEKDIYACGDVAEFNNIVYGNWPAAIEMGKSAGANANGVKKAFSHFTSSIILQALNTEVCSIGLINFNDKIYEQISSKNLNNNKYTKLFFKDNILVGAIILGDISKAGEIILSVENRDSKALALSKNIL